MPDGDGWIDPPIYPLEAGPLPPANLNGDIQIFWDNTQAIGDWALAAGDVQTGQDLETACLVSLFSDKLATPDFTPTDGTSDRRGWWAAPYLDDAVNLGSNLWQLDRAHKTRATLGIARSYTLDCLQWLIDDGIAKLVLCNTFWIASNNIGIAVAIVKPDGTQTQFMFGWAWTDLAILPSPVQMVDPFG